MTDSEPLIPQSTEKTTPSSPRFKFPRFRFSKLKLSKFSIFGVFALMIGLGVAVFGLQQQQDQRSKAAEPNEHAAPQAFVENAKKGLHWGGLKENKGGPCPNSFEFVDKNGKSHGCTHGPDPAPEGVDVTKDVEPLSIGEDLTQPVLAQTIPCEGDGQSGYRVQALYVYAVGYSNRYVSDVSMPGKLRQYAQVADNVMSGSSGGSRHFRFVTNSACQPTFLQVAVSTAAMNEMATMISELKSKGYDRTDRIYMAWTDWKTYCGIGSIWQDDRIDQTNANNSGPTYSRVDNGCWGGLYESHELMHNLGGVQLSAPHSNVNSVSADGTKWHCIDRYDRMCEQSTYYTNNCPSTDQRNIYDCNKDDYFNTNPPAGNYLATHWNTANNRFVIGAVMPLPIPTNVSASCPTPGTTATITWTLPSGYSYAYPRFYDETNGKTFYPASMTGTSYSMPTTPGHKYSYWVHTTNAAGSPYSSEVPTARTATITCIAPPPQPPPTNVSASCPAPGTTATVTWTPVSGYSWYYPRFYDETTGATYYPAQMQTTSYSMPTTPGHKYSYWVHTTNAAGIPFSSEVPTARTATVTCNAQPPPTNVNGSCSSSGTVFTVTWTPVLGYPYYLARIYDQTTSTSYYPGVTTKLSYSITAVPGHKYSYWVHTTNSAGTPYSTEVPTALTVSKTCPIP